MKQFQRSIFFTKKPLGGFFRYRDVFQIFPATLENQPFSSAQKHFPNILEYWLEDDEIVDLGSPFEEIRDFANPLAAGLRKQDLILSLLTAFSNNLFFRYTDTNGYWGYPILKEDAGEEANTWETKWCLPIYTFNGFPEQMKITEFSHLELIQIKQVEHKVFYVFFPDLDHSETGNVIFPETLQELFDAYYNLETDKTKTINIAISHSANAVELLDSKPTLSMVSSFTCLETMISLEFSDVKAEQCKECGQKKYSISQKFKDFLFKYVATSDTNKKKFNQYYSLRSKIIHSGNTLSTEKLFSDVPDADRELEFLKRIEVLQMGKLAITNWLLINERAKGT